MEGQLTGHDCKKARLMIRAAVEPSQIILILAHLRLPYLQIVMVDNHPIRKRQKLFPRRQQVGFLGCQAIRVKVSYPIDLDCRITRYSVTLVDSRVEVERQRVQVEAEK